VSDEADAAHEAEQAALRAALSLRKKSLREVGKCYNCDEELHRGLFCDADCRDDYTRRTTNAIQLGT
jgi:hypothetical protein